MEPIPFFGLRAATVPTGAQHKETDLQLRQQKVQCMALLVSNMFVPAGMTIPIDAFFKMGFKYQTTQLGMDATVDPHFLTSQMRYGSDEHGSWDHRC